MSKIFKILSIDGGGIKGLYSAKILEHLEQRFSCSISDYFDLICGTSTGGLIALALALKIPANKISEFYEQYGKQIFPRRTKLGGLIRQTFWQGKYSDEPLRAALRSIFEEKKIAEAQNLLCIPSYTITDARPWVFKYDHREGKLDRDNKALCVDVALATSAAPTYFPLAEISYYDKKQFIDGGVWANNPTMVGVLEALTYFVGEGKEFDSIEVLSISSLNNTAGKAIGLKRRRSFIKWRNDLFETSLIGQSDFTHYMMSKFCDMNHIKIRYVRIPSESISAEQQHLVKLDVATDKAIDFIKGKGNDRGELAKKDPTIESFFKERKNIKYNHMANCNLLFTEYNRVIRLSDSKRQELLFVRNDLRSRLQTGYLITSKKFGIEHQMIHQSQGSFVMDTIIVPLRDDYDIDDGVYFIGNLDKKTRPSPAKFHDWVRDALDRGHDDIEKIIDKTTCIRVLYKSGFHVDIPIYYADNTDAPDLADKNNGWILSHPIEFIEWFENKIASGFQKKFITETRMFNEFEKWTSDIRKRDHQLRKIVRYMKAWGDLRREEMPCGLVMTILAANNYSPHERDDISLKETLVNIHAALRRDFKCERPTTPEGEDLLRNYKNKDAFMKYLGYFIDNAKKGLEEPNQKLACKHWQSSLGDRFPCHLAKNETTVSAAATSLGAGVSTQKPWAR